MGLIKRRKQPKPATKLPARQIRCYHCGTTVFSDDRPGDPHPAYECPVCGRHYPPTRQEVEANRKIKEVAAKKALRRMELAKRHSTGRQALGLPPFYWAEEKLTKAQKAEHNRAEREREILVKSADELTAEEWKWLGELMASIIPEHPQGRKPKQEYDTYLHRLARAKLKGEKQPRLRELTGIPLPKTDDPIAVSEYKDQMDRARDRFKKAKKSRQVPAPPKT
jgi:hypothetical protein